MLLLTFAVTFFLPERKDARNLYRVLVALPVLLMLSGPILKGFFASKPMRWFAVVSLYFSITLLWGVEPKLFDNFLLRILSVWAFAFLLYYISSFRPELFVQIDKALVSFGLIWMVLILADWGSIWQESLQFNVELVRRGVFSHHRTVGWMFAALTLLSLQRISIKDTRRYAWIIATAFFFVLLVLTQSRGGLLVFIVGLMTWFLIDLRSLNLRLFVLLAVGSLCVLIGISVLYPELITSLVSRGVAHRFEIWQNWHAVWQTNIVKMIFGYGLGAPAENMIRDRLTAAHFHNFYLNTIFYGGVVGFSLTVGWFSSVVRSIYQKRRFDSPWIPLVAGTLTGFLTDGDKLFNYPGAFVFCFILPVFCLSFSQNYIQVE